VARRDRAGTLRHQPEDLRAIDVQHEDHLPEIHHDIQRVLSDPGQVRELVKHVLDLRPHRRGSVDARQERTPVGDADREGEAGLEWLYDQLAVVPFLDSPVVQCGKLEIQHAGPLLRHVRSLTAAAKGNGHRNVKLTLDYSRPRPSMLSSMSCVATGCLFLITGSGVATLPRSPSPTFVRLAWRPSRGTRVHPEPSPLPGPRSTSGPEQPSRGAGFPSLAAGPAHGGRHRPRP